MDLAIRFGDLLDPSAGLRGGEADVAIVDVPTRDRTWRDYWYATSHRRGRRPRIGATAHSMEGMLEAIRAGLGVAVTIESVVSALGPASGIVFRPIDSFEPVEFYVAWHAGDQRAEVADFVDTAVSAIPAAP